MLTLFEQLLNLIFDICRSLLGTHFGRQPYAMFCRFSLRKGIEGSILAGQQNCRSCKISASGMLSARWPASGAQPPVRSGHRASVKEATARPCSEAGMKPGCLLFTKASQSPTSIPLGIDSPKSPLPRLHLSVAGPLSF